MALNPSIPMFSGLKTYAKFTLSVLRSLPRKRYRESDDEDFYEKENHIPKVSSQTLKKSLKIFRRDALETLDLADLSEIGKLELLLKNRNWTFWMRTKLGDRLENEKDRHGTRKSRKTTKITVNLPYTPN